MADLATLGFSVDSTPIESASKKLGDFTQAGKGAQLSTDVLVASAVRLGISVDEVQRRLAVANDNMAANAAQAIKLADATKQISAANDNYSRSMDAAGKSTTDAGGGFLKTVEHVVSLAAGLKLLGTVALAVSPAARSLAYSWTIGPVLAAVGNAALSTLATLARLTPAALIIAGTFELLSNTWAKGTVLLDKYANSLRELYNPETVQNLEKLTKGQKDIISAEQVARATELGSRLQDAQFTIDQMLKLSFDLTDPALKLQAVWVNIKETVAAILLYMNGSGNETSFIETKLKEIGNLPIWDKISGRKSGEVIDLSFPGESQLDPSLKAATDRLSAMMGVAALAAEALKKTTAAADDLDKELNIGSSFIARYSDDIKKLIDGVKGDTWDRTSVGISKMTASLVANSESVGRTIGFQEQLRVETKLLESTKDGLNAATDDQIAKFAELRGTMEAEQALQQAGIKLDKERIQTLIDLSKAAGDARQQRATEAAALANTKALQSDQFALQALTAYSATQKGVIADLQKRNELESQLKSGALTQEQIDARAASARKVAIDTELHQLSEAARARALAADQTSKTAQVSIDAMGKSVGENYRLTTIEQTRQQLEQDASARHTIINQKELADLTEKINQTSKLKQLEAEQGAKRTADFELQTVFMSETEKQIATIQRQLHGDDWKNFMNDGLAATMRITDGLKTLTDGLKDVGKAAFSAALQGKLGMDGLISTLDAVAKKLADKAFDNILSGDPTQMAIGAVQAGASALISAFTGDQKAKKALDDAKAQWAKMSEQVVNFNLAAKGFDLGPLTSALQSLHSTSKELQDAAAKAHDFAGEASAANAFNSAVERIWTEFKTGTQTLDPLQQQIKNVNDEAAGLKETLNELGFSGRAAQIDGIVQQQIDALTKQFNATFITGLTARLNTAEGKTFLNDAANLLAQHQQDLTQAGELGNDPTLLSQVAITFKAEAQKIVDGAELVGTAFTDFTTQFPILQGVVHEFVAGAVTDAKALQDAQNSAAKNLTDFLANLQAGSGSTQSPLATLASAQTLYQTNLPLAQAGNIDAQNKFVSLADDLEKAARVVYASGQGYQDIRNQIINQGLGLPAVQATTDPVTQAVRDAITAIQIGNAALNTINTTASGTTGAVNNVAGIQSGTLLPAINAGNATAVANALQTYFNQIDPTGKLASIINTTNATSLNTLNTRGSVDALGTPLDATKINTLNTRSSVDSGNSVLNAIKSLQDTATQNLILMQSALAPGNTAVSVAARNSSGVLTGGPSQTVSNLMVAALNKIVVNTYMTALNTNLIPHQDGGGIGVLAQGGVIPAGGLALVSEHSPGGGRFLRAGTEPITVSPYAPQSSFRGSNDNNSSSLLAELKRLNEKIDRLEAVVAGSDAMTRRAIEENGDKIENSLNDQTDALNSQERQSNRQRKVAGRR